MSDIIIRTGIMILIVGGVLLILGYHLFRRAGASTVRRRRLPVPPIPEDVMAAIEREVNSRLKTHPRSAQFAQDNQWGDVINDIEASPRPGDELVLAYAYYSLGDPGEAMSQLEKRLCVQPRDTSCRLLCIRLLQEATMFCAAEVHIRVGLAQEPDHPAMVLYHSIGKGMKVYDDELPLCDHFARWLAASAASSRSAPAAAAASPAQTHTLTMLRKKLDDCERERIKLEERLRR